MTSYLTIDASFAYRLIIPNPNREQLKQLSRQWREEGHTLCAPTLWVYELTSALTKMVRFDQLDAEKANRALTLAQRMGIQPISPTEELAQKAFAWTRRLNRAAAYDSFYLALAETLGSEFWTADKRLYNAANESWVHWTGELVQA